MFAYGNDGQMDFYTMVLHCETRRMAAQTKDPDAQSVYSIFALALHAASLERLDTLHRNNQCKPRANRETRRMVHPSTAAPTPSDGAAGIK
jgi:hypothetical protein